VLSIHTRQNQGLKAFSGAYIVSTNGNKMDKAIYLATKVLTPLWDARKRVMPREGDTLAAFHARLMAFDGMGGFLAGQVVADLKYAEGSPLSEATDWHTWAASGPGSRRGLNRVCDNDNISAPWVEWQWLQVLQELREEVNAKFPANWEPLHAQDLQNACCEFDKYERARSGEGRPRSLYPGGVA
jgi:hypothetical protein